MVDFAEIPAIVAALGVIVGVVFTVLELRNLVKQRQTDLVMRLYSTYGSEEFQTANRRLFDIAVKDYASFLKQYGASDVLMVGTFFEGIGVLLKRKLIDIGLVDDLFSEPIRFSWERMKQIIEYDRKRLNQPRIFEWFEYLAHELKKREQQPSGTA